MLKQVINGALRPLGYEIHDVSRVRITANGWEQYRFVKPDGSFDYPQYKQLQDEQSRRGEEMVWVSEANIALLSGYLRKHAGRIGFGICHGSKRGKEQEWFKQYLGGGKILGTDIAEWAKDFPDTIQWDFHDVKPEWRGACDFIYSNALDHSYDPEKALTAWLSCVKPGGFCLIEWHVYGEPLNITDPFSATLPALVYAITKWGKGKFWVRELVPSATNPEYVNTVVIEKAQGSSPPKTLT